MNSTGRRNATHLYLVPPDYLRRRLHERLVQGLSAELLRFDHVAGIVLSSAPKVGSTVGADDTWENLDGHATSLVCTTHPPFWRESLVAAGPNETAKRQQAEWSSWYATVGTWPNRAVNHLDLPPFAGLVQPTSRVAVDND